MSQQLTPEKRPDRNGNLVTRWIRSFSKSGATKSIPAPKSPKGAKYGSLAANHDETITAAKRHLISSGIFNPNPVTTQVDRTEDNFKFLLDNAPDVFHAVLESAKPATAEMYLWQNRLRHLEIDPTSVERTLLPYRQSLIVYPFVRRLSADDPDFQVPQSHTHKLLADFDIVVSSVVRGAASQATIPSDETIEAIADFVYIRELRAINGQGWGEVGIAIYRDNKEDIDFISNHLYEVRALLPELKRRKSHDKETIRMLLDSPSVSLREGEL